MSTCDFHLHSACSDGTDSPEELAVAGQTAGLTVMALTDHDTMVGVADFAAACADRGIQAVAGVELSAEVEHGTLHLLGLGIDPENTALNEALGRVLDGREWRNQQILARLNDLGLEMTWEEVEACSGDGVIGRLHFAQALIHRDYVATPEEAFSLYLGKGAPAYVDRFRLYPEEAITLIRGAGGLAVLAHPFTWFDTLAELETALLPLIAHGLHGIEAYYAGHTLEQTVDLLRLATRHNLLRSAGSDYHGANRSDTPLGALSTPDEQLRPLLAALGL